MVHIDIRISYLSTCISAEVYRQIRVLLVRRGVGCGGWRGLPVRQHSYGGHRVELWRIADWLNNDKTMQLKVARRVDNSGLFLGLHQPVAPVD